MKRLLVLLAACGGTVPHESVTLPPPATSSASAPPATPDSCARVRTEQRAKLRSLIEIAKKSDADAWRDPSIEPAIVDAFFGHEAIMGLACHPFARGAWSLEARSITLHPDQRGAAADLDVVLYVDGERRAWGETLPSGQASMFVHLVSRVASDYDRDGIPELWTMAVADGVEGGHIEHGEMFGLAGKDVKPYAPAEGLGTVQEPRDVDGDGLLDLPTDFSIHLYESTECYGKPDWAPAKFLAHALSDGTFSTDDAAAKAFVRSWCAAPPAKIESPTDALCARLWKRPRALVQGSCIPWSCTLESESKPQPKGATRDCAMRLLAYDATVPFTLP